MNELDQAASGVKLYSTKKEEFINKMKKILCDLAIQAGKKCERSESVHVESSSSLRKTNPLMTRP